MSENEDEVEVFGDDPQIATKHGKVPYRLICLYIVMPLWGLIWFYYFWNGSYGWLDRGYWHQLQNAANTTFPSTDNDALQSQDKNN